MFQKLMLAAIMTFALNLVLGMRPPANAQDNLSAKVDEAQTLTVRTIYVVSKPILDK